MQKLLERPKNLAEETAHFWDWIKSGYYDFLRSECGKFVARYGLMFRAIGEVDATTIQGLTLNEVLETYDIFVLPRSSTRRKLSVHLVAAQTENSPRSTSKVVSDDAEASFKAGLACSTAALPVRRAGHEGILAPRL